MRRRAALVGSASVLWAATAAAQVGPVEAVDWRGAEPGFTYFRHEVLPALRSRCGAPECHGGFAGGRLRVPAALETGEFSDPAAQIAYRSALSLVNPADREASLILTKPLAAGAAAGPVVPHAGPKALGPDAPAESTDLALYKALVDWVKGRRVANYTPYAFAGRDRIVAVGETVALDGSQSFDPNPDDLRRLRYEWTAVAAPGGPMPVLKGAGKPLAEFVAQKPGAYVFRLTVKDRARRSDPSYVSIIADPLRVAPRPTDPDVRADQVQRLGAADAAVGKPAKLQPDAAAPDRLKLVVPGDAAGEGRAEWPVTIAEAGRYGVWVHTIDPGEGVDPTIGLEVDGRLLARVPVALDGTWRMQRPGGVRVPAEAPAGPAAGGGRAPVLQKHAVASGRWQVDPNNNRLVAFGRGLGLAGRNIADLGIVGDQNIHFRAIIHPTDKTGVRNGYFVFDYKSPTDFKIAGLSLHPANPAEGVFEIDWIRPGPAGNLRRTVAARLEPNFDYQLTLKLSGNEAALWADGRPVLTGKFPDKFTGRLGLGSFSAETEFDGVFIWKNREFVFGNLAGRPALREDDEDAGEDPAARLRAHRPPSMVLRPGRHRIALLLPPGAPPIAGIMVARLDAPADVPVELRRIVRAVYLDVPGRPPLEAELGRDAGKPAGVLARDLAAGLEFQQRLYEDELVRLGLVQLYRPTAEDDPPLHYPAIPARLASGATTWRDAVRALVLGTYFFALHYDAEDYPRAAWRLLLGAELLDDPAAAETARAVVGAEIAGNARPPPSGKLFGRAVRSREELIDACLAQPAFAEGFARRLYRTTTGLEPDAETVQRGGAQLARGWNAGREALPDVVQQWIESPAYAARLRTGRAMDDGTFVRAVLTDVLGRAAEAHESRRIARVFERVDAADVRAGLRAAVVAIVLSSPEADLPDRDTVEARTWIEQQLIRLTARAPTQPGVRALAEIMAEPRAGPRLLLEAILTHPLYTTY